MRLFGLCRDLFAASRSRLTWVADKRPAYLRVGHDLDSTAQTDNDFLARAMSPRRLLSIYRLLVATLCVIALSLSLIILTRGHPSRPPPHQRPQRVRPWLTGSIDSTAPGTRKALVLATLKYQDLSWLSEVPAGWEIYRYQVDDHDPSAALTVPRNQGREAMAYLSFIIDEYHSLPDYVVFSHGHRRAWHQPEPLPMKLAALNLTALSHDRYVSLRCETDPGCTERTLFGVEKQLDPHDSRAATWILPAFWRLVFPEDSDWGMGPPPEKIGGPCCAQFAVSRDAILAHPLDFWTMYRKPLQRDLNDYFDVLSKDANSYAMGAVYERLWHIVMGMEDIHCPDISYCNQVQYSNAINCNDTTHSWDDPWEGIVCDLNMPQS